MGIFDRGNQTGRPVQAAAGGVVRGGSPSRPEAVIKRQAKWQQRVLAFADSVPEVSHAASFVHHTTQRVKFAVEGTNTSGEVVERMLEDFDLGRACELIFLVGEFLAVFGVDEETGRVRWKVLAPGEYRLSGRDKPLEVRKQSGKFEPLDPNWSYFRVWRRCRQNRYEATSSHRAQVDLLEALYLHQLADAAVASSRLAGAGILYVPNDLAPSMPRTKDGQPEDGSLEQIIDNLVAGMRDSIKDRTSDDAYVPFMLTGDPESAQSMRHILMERADDAKAFAERMEEYAKRYGRSVELPKEVVTGMESANHWTAWKVDENTWSYYLEPVVQLVLNGLAESFLREVDERLIPGRVSRATITADPRDVVAKPDRTDAALRARQLGILSAEAALRYMGFDPATDMEPNETIREQGFGGIRELPSRFRDSQGRASGEDVNSGP